MKTLNEILIQEHVSPNEIMTKKGMKYIMGGCGNKCGWESSHQVPCQINWSGDCVFDNCNEFFSSTCVINAAFAWCHG